MSDHARLSPSSSSRWRKCPGSARVDLPEEQSSAAAEGTHAHGLGEAWLLTNDPPAFPNEEMREAVETYYNFCQDLPGDMYLEQRLRADNISEEFWGTVDCLRVTPTEIYAVDFKYGTWEVRPEGNDQLSSYLALARENFPGRRRFFGAIVQPRVRKPYLVEFEAKDLDEFVDDVKWAAGSDELVAGEHCQFCPLLKTCEVAELEGKRIAELTLPDLDDPETEEAKAKCLRVIRYAKVIDELKSHAQKKLVELAMQGATIPGMKLAEPPANRTWIDEKRAYEELRALGLRKRDIIQEKLVSPATFDKTPHADKVASLYHRPLRPVTLVPKNRNLPTYNPDPFDDVEINNE